ncbi:MAG TPA: discoidin domain-containing protein [Opitutus sp.]|nr:discoidin domain-containing protein [Opitutus sp.]
MRSQHFVIVSEATDPAARSIIPAARLVVPLAFLALLLAASCSTPPASQTETQNTKPKTSATSAARPAAAANADALATLNYAASQQPVADLDRDIAAAGNDPAKLAPIAHRLFALLQSRGTTFAARQAICQRLAEFPAAMLTTDEARATFASMLADDTEINLARLALEPVRSDSIDALFLDALGHASPVTQLALVQSVGNRHLAAAVPLIAPLVRDADARLAAAAVRALAQIATPAALDALRTAPDPAAPDVVEASLAIARALPAANAVSIYNATIATRGAPAHLRAAAFLGLLDAEPDQAPARFVAALNGSDRALKPVVIEAIAAHPAPELTRVLASELSRFDAPTQAAVIAALGRRGDPAANRAIVAAVESADAGVRAAAFDALSRLPGSGETAAALANAVAHGNSDDIKLARQALARLDGPGVSAAVVAGAASGSPALRIVYLQAIGDRYMTESVPVLLKTRGDSDAAIRIAALAALADIAPPPAESAVLDWALAATDPAEQSRALRSVVSVALRNPDLEARAAPLVAALAHADSAAAQRLIPALPHLGGTSAVNCAARLATGDDAALSAAAITALSRWPDAAGLNPLIAAAGDAPKPAVRASALEAATRFLERDRALKSPDLTNDLSRLLAAAPAGPVRLRLVHLLDRCSDDAALKLAEQQQGDPAVAAAASDAVLAIRSNLAGPPVVSVSSGSWSQRNLLDGNVATSWNVAATPGQWFQLDFHSPRAFRRIVLDETGSEDDFPVGYAVFVTDDPDHPGEPRVTGAGQPARTTIELPAGTRGRYLIVRHVGERDGTAWTVSEVLID